MNGLSPFARADFIEARRWPATPEAGIVAGAGGMMQAAAHETAASQKQRGGMALPDTLRAGGKAGAQHASGEGGFAAAAHRGRRGTL